MAENRGFECADCVQIKRIEDRLSTVEKHDESYEKRITDLEKNDSGRRSDMKTLFNMISEIKDGLKDLNQVNRDTLAELKTNYKEDLKKLENFIERQGVTFNKRLTEIEQKPAKRWDLIMTVIITGIVTALTTAMISGIIK